MTSRTSNVTIPSFVKTVDAVGEISISLTLNSQPSLTYQLVSDSSFPSSLTDNNVKYNIYSCYYRVQNASESIDIATGQRRLTVSMEGWYRPLLEKEVLVGGTITNNKVSLNKIAAKAGVLINGRNSGKTRKVREPYLTTLGSEVSQYMVDEGLVVVFDTGVKFEEEGQGSFITVASNDVLNLDVNHKKDHVYSYKMLPQYITFEKEDDDNADDAESQKPMFEIIPRAFREVVLDPENAKIPPVTGLIKTLDMNVDMSGQTKTIETTVYEGEKTIRKSVVTYGYAYTTDSAAQSVSDVHSFAALYESYWRIVEQYTIEYVYDDGHYVGYDKFGYKLTRFAQESEAFELLEASLSSDPNVQLEAAQYRFRQVPIVEYERLDLEAFSNYYPDSKPNPEEIYIRYEEYNDKTRRTEVKYERDKSYVLPMFIKKRVMYSRCFAYLPLPYPAIAEYQGQVVTTGEERKEITTVEILPSKGTGGSETTEDAFTELREIEVMQDANFKNHIKSTESIFNFGRPGSSEYFQQYQLVEKNTSTKNETLMDEQKWTVSSGVTSNISSPTGSINIPRAKYLAEAVRLLQKQINIQRKFEDGEFTITTFFNQHAKPNGKLMVAYKGRSYVGTIKTVTHNIKILGKNKASGFTTMTASISNQADVFISLKKEQRPPTPSSYYPGATRKRHTQIANFNISSVPGRGKFNAN